MAIGGADSVRGYPQSELLGDNGFQVSIEGRYVLNPDDPNKWQAAFFVDYGSIYVKNPVAGQSKSQHLTGVGIGLRGAPREDLSIRADIGYGISGRPSAGGKLQPYIQILKRF
jgi:Hemolysin activation/secretion protein